MNTVAHLGSIKYSVDILLIGVVYLLIPEHNSWKFFTFSNSTAQKVHCWQGNQAGPFFFHGFLTPISRAREIENDEFHGHFTG